MNRTTPPVAEINQDFETVLGSACLSHGKVWYEFNIRRLELYNDLKSLYLQEKEITKNTHRALLIIAFMFYYDWGKSQYLTALYQAANKIVHINMMRFSKDNFEEIPDYDGNTLILSSDKIISEKFKQYIKLKINI